MAVVVEQAIDSATECAVAARESEVEVDGGQSGIVTPQLLAGTAFQQTVAYGCSIFERPDSTSLLFNGHRSAAECGSLTGFYCLCREALTETPATAASPDTTATLTFPARTSSSTSDADVWLHALIGSVVDTTPDFVKYEAITSGSCEDADMEVSWVSGAPSKLLE
jgi:hypothetical protein